MSLFSWSRRPGRESSHDGRPMIRNRWALVAAKRGLGKKAKKAKQKPKSFIFKFGFFFGFSNDRSNISFLSSMIRVCEGSFEPFAVAAALPVGVFFFAR